MNSEPCIGLLPARSDARHLLHLFTSNLLNVLLLAIPFGWAAHFVKWPAVAIFVLVSQHQNTRTPFLFPCAARHRFACAPLCDTHVRVQAWCACGTCLLAAIPELCTVLVR